MKLLVVAGTPGCGKTAVSKQIIRRLKERSSRIAFVKFECLASEDHEYIKRSCAVDTELHLAEDLCPDHYSALMLSRRLPVLKNKYDYAVVETAGLCMRCSPYVTGGALALAVIDATAGKIKGHGPILTLADLVLLTKSDLVSQAEREIMIHEILDENPTASIVETNGLTGEGIDYVIELADEASDFQLLQSGLRGSMPSAICGYCYGSRSLSGPETTKRYQAGKDIKSQIPNWNCGACGYKSCNEFVRAVLDGNEDPSRCPFFGKDLKKN